MSLQYLNAALDADLKGVKKPVLIVLADRANDAGYCYPAIEDTAFRCGFSERTVIRSVLELEKLGLLAVIREIGRGNKYTLLIEKSSTTSDTESLPTDRVSLHPCQSVITPVTECHTNHQLTTINHQLTKERDAPTQEINYENFVLNKKPVSESTQKKQSGFVPPTEPEIDAYAQSQNLSLTGYFDYYTGNGWMTGKNKIKNWQAVARSWDRKQIDFTKNAQGANNGNFKQPTRTQAAADRIISDVLRHSRHDIPEINSNVWDSLVKSVPDREHIVASQERVVR